MRLDDLTLPSCSLHVSLSQAVVVKSESSSQGPAPNGAGAGRCLASEPKEASARDARIGSAERVRGVE